MNLVMWRILLRLLIIKVSIQSFNKMLIHGEDTVLFHTVCSLISDLVSLLTSGENS